MILWKFFNVEVRDFYMIFFVKKECDDRLDDVDWIIDSPLILDGLGWSGWVEQRDFG